MKRNGQSVSSAPVPPPPANVTYITDDSDYEMPDEYEFTEEQLLHAVRGKYYERAMLADGFVKLEPDVQALFGDARDANEALRAFMRDARKRLGENVTAHEALSSSMG